MPTPEQEEGRRPLSDEVHEEATVVNKLVDLIKAGAGWEECYGYAKSTKYVRESSCPSFVDKELLAEVRGMLYPVPVVKG